MASSAGTYVTSLEVGGTFITPMPYIQTSSEDKMEPKEQDGIVCCHDCVFNKFGICTSSDTEITNFVTGYAVCEDTNYDGKCEFHLINRRKEK